MIVVGLGALGGPIKRRLELWLWFQKPWNKVGGVLAWHES